MDQKGQTGRYICLSVMNSTTLSIIMIQKQYKQAFRYVVDFLRKEGSEQCSVHLAFLLLVGRNRSAMDGLCIRGIDYADWFVRFLCFTFTRTSFGLQQVS